MRIDTHVHEIDVARWPMTSEHGYRIRADEEGNAVDLLATLDAHGIDGAVVVQPSGYGTDHRALLDALERAPERLRAVGVAGPGRLAALARHPGIVGVRLNVMHDGGRPLSPERLTATLEEAAEAGLVVEIVAPAANLAALCDKLAASRAPVILDHLGMPAADRGTEAPEFAAVRELGRAPAEIYAKLSAPFRTEAGPPPWRAATACARALLAAFGPDRCLWGSDWPFINLLARPTYRNAVAWGTAVLGESADAVLSRTPRRLFRFGETAA